MFLILIFILNISSQIYTEELPKYRNVPASSDSTGKNTSKIVIKPYKEDPEAIVAVARVENLYNSVKLLLDIIEKPEEIQDIIIGRDGKIIEEKTIAVSGLVEVFYKLKIYPQELRRRTLDTLYSIMSDATRSDTLREYATFSYAIIGQSNVETIILEAWAKKEPIKDDFKKAVLGIKGLTYIYSKASTEAIIRVLNSSIGGNSDFYGFIDEKGNFTRLSNNPIPRLALLALASRGVNPTESIGFDSSLTFLGKEIGSHGRVAREAVVNYTDKHKGFEDIRKAMVEARIEDFGKHMVYILGNIYVFAMTVGMGWAAEAEAIAVINAAKLYNTSYNQAGTIRLINALKGEETMAAARQLRTVIGRDMAVQVGLDMPLSGRSSYIAPDNPEGLPLYPDVVEPFYLPGGSGATAVLTKPIVQSLVQEGIAPADMVNSNKVSVINNTKPSNSLQKFANSKIEPIKSSSDLIRPVLNSGDKDKFKQEQSTKIVGSDKFTKNGNYWFKEGDLYKKPYMFNEKNALMEEVSIRNFPNDGVHGNLGFNKDETSDVKYPNIFFNGHIYINKAGYFIREGNNIIKYFYIGGIMISETIKIFLEDLIMQQDVQQKFFLNQLFQDNNEFKESDIYKELIEYSTIYYYQFGLGKKSYYKKMFNKYFSVSEINNKEMLLLFITNYAIHYSKSVSMLLIYFLDELISSYLPKNKVISDDQFYVYYNSFHALIPKYNRVFNYLLFKHLVDKEKYILVLSPDTDAGLFLGHEDLYSQINKEYLVLYELINLGELMFKGGRISHMNEVAGSKFNQKNSSFNKLISDNDLLTDGAGSKKTIELQGDSPFFSFLFSDEYILSPYNSDLASGDLDNNHLGDPKLFALISKLRHDFSHAFSVIQDSLELYLEEKDEIYIAFVKKNIETFLSYEGVITKNLSFFTELNDYLKIVKKLNKYLEDNMSNGLDVALLGLYYESLAASMVEITLRFSKMQDRLKSEIIIINETGSEIIKDVDLTE